MPLGDCCEVCWGEGDCWGLESSGLESGLKCRLVDDLEVGVGDSPCSGLSGGWELELVVERSCGEAACTVGGSAYLQLGTGVTEGVGVRGLLMEWLSLCCCEQLLKWCGSPFCDEELCKCCE